MKGSPKRASNSPRQSARAPVVLDLPTVQKMLPLVRRIVADLLAAEQDNGSLLWELEGLDRNRRTLTWPERQRRYQIQDEITRRLAQNAFEDLAKVTRAHARASRQHFHGKVGVKIPHQPGHDFGKAVDRSVDRIAVDVWNAADAHQAAHSSFDGSPSKVLMTL